MGDKSGIEWTDATWNVATGCTKISPGCAHCYIERSQPFRMQGRQFVRGNIDVQLHPDRLVWPLRWQTPRLIFVNSLSDLFHESISFDFVAAVFGVMAATPRHTYQVLTKRPERMKEWFRIMDLMHEPDFEHDMRPSQCWHQAITLGIADSRWPGGHRPPWPLPNVWIGVSTENQRMLDERVALLREIPAAVRFISAEPLLADLHVMPYLLPSCPQCGAIFGGESIFKVDDHCGRCLVPILPPCLDWVLVGGESGGPGVRPCDLAWVRSVRDQCGIAKVACFIKQLGAFPAETFDDGHYVPVLLRDRKGGDMEEWAEDLRVRQYP